MLCIYKYFFIYEVQVEVTTENALLGVDSFQSSQSLTVNFGSSAQVSSLLLCHKTYKSRNSTCLKKLLWQESPRKITGLITCKKKKLPQLIITMNRSTDVFMQNQNQ